MTVQCRRCVRAVKPFGYRLTLVFYYSSITGAWPASHHRDARGGEAETPLNKYHPYNWTNAVRCGAFSAG